MFFGGGGNTITDFSLLMMLLRIKGPDNSIASARDEASSPTSPVSQKPAARIRAPQPNMLHRVSPINRLRMLNFQGRFDIRIEARGDHTSANWAGERARSRPILEKCALRPSLHTY